MATIVAALSNLGAAIAAGFRYVTGRQALKNSKPMQANAAAATDQALKQRIEADMESGDLSKIQKDQADAAQ